MTTLILSMACLAVLQEIEKKPAVDLDKLSKVKYWAFTMFGLGIFAMFAYISFVPAFKIQPYKTYLQVATLGAELLSLCIGVYVIVQILNLDAKKIGLPILWVVTLSIQIGIVWGYNRYKRRVKISAEAFQHVRDVYNQLKGRVSD
jgi:hypothetical protein